MTKEQYNQMEAFVIVKYGSVDKAIDHWLETDKEEDGFDMLDFYLAQTPKDITDES